MPMIKIEDFTADHPDAQVTYENPEQVEAAASENGDEYIAGSMTDEIRSFYKDHPGLALAGAVAVVGLGFMAGANLAKDTPRSPAVTTEQPQTELPPVKPHKSKPAKPSDGPVKASPSVSATARANVVTPTDWQDCNKPVVHLTVSAGSAIDVAVKLRGGGEAPVMFQSDKQNQPTYPRAMYSGNLGVAACVAGSTAESALTTTDTTITLNRGSVITNGMFPDVTKPGSGAKETVQGLGKELPATAQVTKKQAAAVNALMLAGGKYHEAYTKTVDWLLRAEILKQITAADGTQISQLLDADLLADIKKANPGDKRNIVLTGQYPSLEVAFQQVTSDFKPVERVSLVRTSSEKPTVAATIIKTGGQA